VDNTPNAQTVTIEDTVGVPNTVGSGTFSWAIGGVRATLAGANSRKLVDNNTGKGDALPGWVIEFQSGHAETFAATLILQRTNCSGIAPIIIRGAANAAVRPIITFSSTAIGFTVVGGANGFVLQDFDMKNSSGNTTTSIAIGSTASSCVVKVTGVNIKDATSTFWKGISFTQSVALYLENCEIAHCVSMGVDCSVATNNQIMIRHNRIHDNGSHGIEAAVGDFYDNYIYSNTGDGLHLIKTGAASTFAANIRVTQNTITGNGGDAVEITSSTAQTAALYGTVIENNVLTGNTGYALNWSGASQSAAILSSYYVTIRGNTMTGNSGASNSGKYNIDLSTIVSSSSQAGFGASSTGGGRIGLSL
jgi:hypothetical protein